ncbi:class I SAM-dependent methyltransferase [Deinococcus arcticus]|uniref:rRNA (Guanine-N2)-methyltransferase n=1 Tax=Deinococcus arcticus TaxID=2136176 RepID=A0A2T3WDC9_9DEIO|nr:class I SAM-dependent methyltransferase [Deinococcus arcticus]PTA69887.1 rRNA (guanine-N2)-methyltransferase [Deinococcus arcticus]
MPDPAALLTRRAHLSAQGSALYRAAHTTETHGVYALDLAGRAGVLNLYAPLTATQETALAAQWGEVAGVQAVYLKRRPVEARHAANVARDQLSPPEPVWGEPLPELVATEAGVPFLIRPGADLSTGLFTDARPARAWVRAHSAGRRVLNTFAYTCGFGLSAALGGAAAVKNVDLSRKVLAWGQANYALSGLSAPEQDFLYGDVFEWLTRLERRGDHFDLVVLDPPSFARGKSGVWRAERDYARLAGLAARVTAPGGRVLTLLNHAGVSGPQLGRMVQSGLREQGRQAALQESFGAGEDYPEAEHLKVQVWALD